MSNLLIIPILFFVLGFFARLIKSDLKLPEGFGKILAIYLMISIGLKGGIELSHANLGASLKAVAVAFGLGILQPLIAYGILCKLGKFDKLNAAAIAAHYGSVSVGTFLAATGFLTAEHVVFGSYPIVMLAIMEFPSILIGLLLAQMARGQMAHQNNKNIGMTIYEAITNGSVILLAGTLLIGFIALPESLATIKPFYTDIFNGLLSLFLLAMGLEAATRIREFYQVGVFLILFGIFIPLLGGFVGVLCGHYLLNFAVGDTFLVGVLAASASYVAVPPAMKLAIPESNSSFYLTLTLGVTFPFNVILGIPIYYSLAKFWS